MSEKSKSIKLSDFIIRIKLIRTKNTKRHYKYIRVWRSPAICSICKKEIEYRDIGALIYVKNNIKIICSSCLREVNLFELISKIIKEVRNELGDN